MLREKISRIVFKCHSGTHRLFQVLGSHVKGVRHRSVLHVIVGLVRCLLRMLFLNIHHMISMQRQFLGLFEATSYSIWINLKPFSRVVFSINMYFIYEKHKRYTVYFGIGEKKLIWCWIGMQGQWNQLHYMRVQGQWH